MLMPRAVALLHYFDAADDAADIITMRVITSCHMHAFFMMIDITRYFRCPRLLRAMRHALDMRDDALRCRADAVFLRDDFLSCRAAARCCRRQH